MTREEFASTIKWHKVIFLIGCLNPAFMLPQLYQIWLTSDTRGVSLLTLIILIGIQSGFGAHGFFTRDRILLASNGAAATVTLTTTLLVWHFNMAA